MGTTIIKRFEEDIFTNPASILEIGSTKFIDSRLQSTPPFVIRDYRIQFLSYFIKQSYNSILDISCGKNATILKWAKWLGLDVIGTNIEKSSIEQNRRDGIECCEVDLNSKNLNLPFKDNSFDVVVSTEVIEHIKSPKIVIDEMFRVSKYLCFITTPVGDSYHSPDHIQYWYTINDFINDVLYDYPEYTIRTIVTKPADLILNQRSFVITIHKN